MKDEEPLPRYEEGDIIQIGKWGYEVKQVDISTFSDDERPHQYRLERLNDSAPAANLEPNYDGEDSAFVVSLFKEAEPTLRVDAQDREEDEP